MTTDANPAVDVPASAWTLPPRPDPVPLGRCPSRGCPVRWRTGGDRLCARHAQLAGEKPARE